MFNSRRVLRLFVDHSSLPAAATTAAVAGSTSPPITTNTTTRCFRSIISNQSNRSQSSSTSLSLPSNRNHSNHNENIVNRRSHTTNIGKRNLMVSMAHRQVAAQVVPNSRCPFHNDKHVSNSSTSVNEQIASSTSSSSGYLPFESIPTPNGLPIIGTLLDLIKAGGAEYVHQYCDKRHQTLGPIYKERLGNVEAVFISDAKLVQQVYQHEGKYPQHMVPEPWIIYNQNKGIRRGLFFMEGEEWSVRRSILNKVFLKPDVINEYTGVFNQVVTDILEQWSNRMKANDHNNDTLLIDTLEKELYNWSIESLGTMIFGRRLGCIVPKPDQSSYQRTALPDIHEFVHCVQQIFVESANMQLIPPKLAHYFNLPVWKRFEKAAGKALDLAFQYVNENAKQVNPGKTQGNGIIKQLLTTGDMQLDEISRIIVDLFIAAADTTSHATQWALYLLSRHEHVQERLYQEIQMITNGQPVNEEHLQNLPYVKGIIKESLRLYPVAPFLTRYLSDDLILGGYRVPKGQLVVISLFTTGRKDEYFDQPQKFMPERWIRDKTTGKNQVNNSHACLPFGLGVRSCIGRRVAEIQMQFFLSRIVQQFQIKPTSDKEIDIKLRMITTPEKSIDLIMKSRS